MSGTITNPGNCQSAQDWLDALSREECDETEFVRAVQGLIREDQDAGWDLLSFLDQYYRRGKIKPEVFRSVKLNLERTLLGAADIAESVSVTQEDSPSAAGLNAPTIASPESIPAPASAAPDIPAATSGETAASARRARPEIAVGDVLRGRYQINSVLHRGGMGTLFEAIDQYGPDLPDASPRLALKVLHGDVTQRPELLAELRREFQRLQSLSHPNIVRVHEYDRDGDTAFFTMEYLSGLSLTRLLAARHQVPLKRSDARSIFRDVGAALAHAHHCGIVHGSLNSGNIFITDEGEVRVLGFGASQILRRQQPEGEAADFRDDLYAFACLVYLLLAGELPFEGHSASRARALGLRPTRPPGLTRRQWRALRSSLHFERDRRPADVDEFLRPFDLRKSAARSPTLLAPLKVFARRPSRKLWLALGAAASVILAAGWWAMTNYDSVASTASAWRLGLVRALGDAGTSRTQSRHSPSDAHVLANAGPPPKAAAAHPAEAATPPVPAEVSNEAPSSPATAPAPSSQPASQTAPAESRAASSNGRSSTQRSRIELAASIFEVPFGDPSAHIVVRRSGNLQTEMNFSWWTETGTAKPGLDYESVAPHVETIAVGKSAANLFVPVVTDLKRQQSTNFYVVIGDPSPDASLGSRTVAMVSIEPSQ